MKKILFVQTDCNPLGGVWTVNKTIGEELIKNGYDVEILGLRNNQHCNKLDCDKKLKVKIINRKKDFDRVHLSDIKEKVKEKRLIKSLELFCYAIKDRIFLMSDFYRLKRYIKRNKYDYVIVTQYELLDAIPKSYLPRTYYEHHTSFEMTLKQKHILKVLDKYKNSVRFIWLTKSSYDLAKKNGYNNSTYIYNPVKFTTNDKANAVKNKKLITITRFSEEKRIDLMIKMIEELFKNEKYKDWKLEIYGDGGLKHYLLDMKYNHEKITIYGSISNVKEKLLSASINLNTSLFEGFSMSILEAQECGVPTVSFDFGESVSEQIIQNKTGIYVKQEDTKAYIGALQELMNNEEKLEEMSLCCKENSKRYHIDLIVKSWIDELEGYNK